MDNVTLGSSYQYNNENLQVDSKETEVICQKTSSLLPNLKKAQAISENVDLHHHPFIHVERGEVELSNDTKISIVHHYGHGEFGFLAPGTALTASKLVRQHLQEKKKNANLI